MNIILFIKGIIIGIAKILPGVSGAMLAITMGIYDKGINVISHFFDDIKGNINFTINVGLGFIIAMIFSSKIVVFFLNKYYLLTMSFFIGLIVGGIINFVKSIDRKTLKKNYLCTIISFFLILIILFIDNKNVVVVDSFNFKFYMIMFFIGIIDIATMIIPGISGTAILMLLGYYDIIMKMFSTLFDIEYLNYNLNILIPFGLGIISGAIILAKIISFFLKNYHDKMSMSILGLSLSSIFILFFKIFNIKYSFLELVFSLLIMLLGILMAKKFS